MIRKGLLIVCSLIMVFAVMGSVAADHSIKLVVNGHTLSPDVPPQLIHDRTMVPIRWVAEALGAKVDWDDQNQTVSIDMEGAPDQQRQVELLQSWIMANSSDEVVKTWAEAVKKRNGAVQFALLSPTLQQQTEQGFAELGWVTGVSSPWVDSYTISDAVELDGASRLYEVVFNEATSSGNAGTMTVNITVGSSDQQWWITHLGGSDDAAAITVLPSTVAAPSRLELSKYEGIQVVDQNTIFLWGKQGSEPVLWRTNSGGARWESVSLKGAAIDANALPNGLVYFLDSNTGWISWSTGGKVKVSATVDGGAHWNTVSLDGVLYPLQMNFINSQQGWLATSSDAAMSHTQKTIYRTVDGGKTWQVVSSDSGYITADAPTPDALPEVGYLRGMVFRTALEGYATITNAVSSDLYFYRTVDGGKRWSPVNLQVPEAVGNNFSLSEFSTPVFFGENQLDGRMIVNFGNADERTAVVYTSHDGGATWQSGAVLPRELDLEAMENIQFTDMNHGWIATGKKLYRTTDGGAAWKAVNGDDTFKQMLNRLPHIQQIQFLRGTTTGWVLFASDQHDQFSLLQTKDGGDTWSQIVTNR